MAVRPIDELDVSHYDEVRVRHRLQFTVDRHSGSRPKPALETAVAKAAAQLAQQVGCHLEDGRITTIQQRVGDG